MANSIVRKPLSGIYARRFSALSHSEAWRLCLELASIIDAHDQTAFNEARKNNQLLLIIQFASPDLYASIERQFSPSFSVNTASTPRTNRIIHSIENYALRCASRATPFSLSSSIAFDLDQKVLDKNEDGRDFTTFTAFREQEDSPQKPNLTGTSWLFKNQLITRLSQSTYEVPLPWNAPSHPASANFSYSTVALTLAQLEVLNRANTGIQVQTLIDEITNLYGVSVQRLYNLLLNFVKTGTLIQINNPKDILDDIQPITLRANSIESLAPKTIDPTTVMARIPIVTAPPLPKQNIISRHMDNVMLLLEQTAPSQISNAYDRWLDKFAENYGFNTAIEALTVFDPIRGIGPIRIRNEDQPAATLESQSLVSYLLDAHAPEQLQLKDDFYILNTKVVRKALTDRHQNLSSRKRALHPEIKDLMFELFEHPTLGPLFMPAIIGSTDPGALLARFASLLSPSEVSTIWGEDSTDDGTEIVELRPIFHNRQCQQLAAQFRPTRRYICPQISNPHDPSAIPLSELSFCLSDTGIQILDRITGLPISIQSQSMLTPAQYDPVSQTILAISRRGEPAYALFQEEPWSARETHRPGAIIDSIVIRRPQWRMPAGMLTNDSNNKAFQSWKQLVNLPSHIRIGRGDQAQEFDISNEYEYRAFKRALGSKSSILETAFFTQNSDDRKVEYIYRHVPKLETTKPSSISSKKCLLSDPREAETASGWLAYEFTTPSGLIPEIYDYRNTIEQFRHLGGKNWHFLHCTNPDPHLRLRFQLPAEENTQTLLRNWIDQSIRSLKGQTYQKLRIVEFYPEYTRYTQNTPIETVYEIFTTSSQLALGERLNLQTSRSRDQLLRSAVNSFIELAQYYFPDSWVTTIIETFEKGKFEDPNYFEKHRTELRYNLAHKFETKVQESAAHFEKYRNIGVDIIPSVMHMHFNRIASPDRSSEVDYNAIIRRICLSRLSRL